jgi:magnesium-transporting ATPase (P-type)
LTITHPILTKIFFLFFFYPGGEHRVEKISENPKSKIERLKKISESISIQKKPQPNFLWSGNKNLWNQRILWEFSSLFINHLSVGQAPWAFDSMDMCAIKVYYIIIIIIIIIIISCILSTKSLGPLIKYICNFWDLVLQWLIYEIT